MRIFLTGAGGQVGRALCARLVGHDVRAVTRADADLSEPMRIVPLVRAAAPDLIINAAADTRVEKIEDDEPAAMRINGDLLSILGGLATELGVGIIHFSTDYVFDGTKCGPYTEGDTPSPMNAYGRTKRAGEHALADACDSWLTCRLSWVYDGAGKNFLMTILKLMAERPELKVVEDQIGAPTPAYVIADVLGVIIDDMIGASSADYLRRRGGFLNVACQGEISWRGFAEEARSKAVNAGLPILAENIFGIPTSEYWGLRARPLNSRLDLSRLADTFGLQTPDWQAALDPIIASLAPQVPKG